MKRKKSLPPPLISDDTLDQPRPPSDQPEPPSDQPPPPLNQPLPTSDQPQAPSNQPFYAAYTEMYKNKI